MQSNNTNKSTSAEKTDISEFLSAYNDTLSDANTISGIPSRISSKYTVDSCLHSDDTGRKEVYLLNRISDGSKVILRVTEDCPEEDALEEAELLSHLDHDGIPKVYDFFEDRSKRYIVREYVEGCSLYEVIKAGGPLNTDDIFGIILKLADILNYLHSRKPTVIHRDIKPQNIILARDGSIHLIDFGIARTHKEDSRQDTTVVLTHDYAPPEQYGFEQTSPLTDIYSTGVLMLFLATGKVIKTNLYAQIVNNDLRNLIRRCIAFDPKSRIQSVDEMIAFIRGTESKGNSHFLKLALIYILSAVIALSGVYYAGLKVGKMHGTQRGAGEGTETGYIEGFEAAPVFSIGDADELPSEGNMACNLSVSGGAFVATGEYQIFYCDNNALYRFNDETGTGELIASVSNPHRLSFANGWLYAQSEGNIIQTQIYTQETFTLWKNAEELRVIDGVYYIFTKNGTQVLNTEKITCEKINDIISRDIMQTDGEHIWYIDDEGNVFRCNMDGSEEKDLNYHNCQCMSFYEGSLYLISENKLIKLTGNDEEFIGEISASKIAVNGRGIYYIDSLDGSIFLSMPDGRIRERISDSRAEDINIAGDYIFYHNAEDDSNLWCVKYDGTNDHRVETGD